MSRVRIPLPDVAALQEELESVRRDVARYKKAAEELWEILDDIDTLSDATRGNREAFIRGVLARCEGRHEVAKSFDGQTLVWDWEEKDNNMTTTKYRKKPLIIEAFQMTRARRTDNSDWPGWLHRAWNLDRSEPGSVFPTVPATGEGTVSIGTLEGDMVVSFDDWIIRGVQGELYPCKPDIFEATYEPVEDDS